MLRYLSHQSSFLSSRFMINWHHVSLFRRLANWKWVLQIYESPEDLDLWSAGVTERPLPGSMVSFIKLKWIECFFIFIHIYEGWSHLGVHYRETVPQLPTGRSVLVRERWLAFLLHSWTGQSLFFFWWEAQLIDLPIPAGGNQKSEAFPCDLRQLWQDRGHPGVRHGPPRPRDQPKGSLQLQPPTEDWSNQVLGDKDMYIGIGDYSKLESYARTKKHLNS